MKLPSLVLILVRPAMRAADRIRRRYWRWRGKPLYGVMVLAHAPGGDLILVRHTYSPGWSLPGGGRSRREDPVAAALRELREEVGATRWKSAHRLTVVEDRYHGLPAFLDLVRVEEVEFAFARNWEIEQVATFPVDRLPPDVTPWSRRLIALEKEGRANPETCSASQCSDPVTR